MAESAGRAADAIFVGQYFDTVERAQAYLQTVCRRAGYTCRIGRWRAKPSAPLAPACDAASSMSAGGTGDPDETSGQPDGAAGDANPPVAGRAMKALTIVCSAERKEHRDPLMPRPRRGPLPMKSGCKWRVNLRNHGAVWEVTSALLEHNHPPISAEVMQSHPFRNPMPTEMRELATFLYQSTPLRVGQIHTTLLQLHGEEMRWTFDDVRNIVQRDGRPQSQDAAELIRILQVWSAWHSARRQGAARD